jgi:hypothetical protein
MNRKPILALLDCAVKRSYSKRKALNSRKKHCLVGEEDGVLAE